MPDVQKPKILIVDDERSNIVALNHILKPECSTLIAIDGQTAIRIAREVLPDLILLDIVMPGMDGFEVITELKRDENTKNIPVIFITGLDSVKDEETGLSLGAADYITKPFHNSIVKARIKTQLRMRRYIREIEQFGLTDTLTGLPNRRSFDDRAHLEWCRLQREGKPLSLLMIDIDRFKRYNDTHGHTQGDVALRTVANVFSGTVRRVEDFAARWGGEEFVVLLPNVDGEGALLVAEEIRRGVEKSVILCPDGTQTSVTVSVGMHTEIPTVDCSIDDLLAKADQAMYHAKNSGRNRVCPFQ